MEDASFVLKIFQPQGRLSAYVQAVWSASVAADALTDTTQWLHGDAGSGILFNLKGPIYLGDTAFASGVVFLPVKKESQSITLPPGSQLVGFRFHPAIGFGVLGTLYDQPTAMKVDDKTPFALHALCTQLMQTKGHYRRMVALYRWLNIAIDFSDVAPASLLQALSAVQSSKRPGQLSEGIPLSQRQLERQFKRWMGMTAKHYQRILRVKKTLNTLKCKPDIDLVNLALQQGFTDQAHMTRECKQIAKITPGQYSKRVRQGKAI